jgi:glycosyltransferase involved in cell wall biosynthesis
MADTADPDPEEPGPSVLHLTTSPDSQFYRTQVAALQRQGVDCETLAVPGTADGRDAEANRTPADYLRFFPLVRRALRRGEYDLVHANYGLTGPHALAQSRAPTVLSLWGTDVYGSFGWLSKLVAPRCDEVIVMSDALGRQLSTEYTVLPHAVDLEAFRPMPRSGAREALGWEPDAHHVLFAAPIAREEKGFPLARRVVRAARERLSTPIVMQTPDGTVPHERMPVLMNAADALLLTSSHEGFPNVVKEALACNLPVVATDVGDLADRLGPVSQCRVGASEDELVAGLATVLQRGERADGRQAVSNLDVDRVARRLRAIYDRLLADGK